jgi:PiT family inorganic phosphate transporter
MDGLVLIVLQRVLAAEFVNGWTDAPNSIATVVSTRVLSPFQALIMASVLNVLGAMSGTAVAATIGKGNVATVGAATVAIVIWSTLAWVWRLPTSESHALVASLSGAALAVAGPSVLLWDGWSKVLIGFLFSTFLGFGGGLLLSVGIYWAFRRSRPGPVRTVFGRLQMASAAFMAFSHGSNDGRSSSGRSR